MHASELLPARAVDLNPPVPIPEFSIALPVVKSSPVFPRGRLPGNRMKTLTLPGLPSHHRISFSTVVFPAA